MPENPTRRRPARPLALAIATALPLLAACTTTVRAPSSSAVAVRDTSTLAPERGAVLPQAAMRQLLNQCSRVTPNPRHVSGYWTPTAQQIHALEAGLTPLLRERLRTALGARYTEDSRVWRYNRQYAGLVLNGRRIIYVNGFTPDPPAAGRDTAHWREGKEMEVCDGWIGYFGVEYDPETNQFSNFAFNGMA